MRAFVTAAARLFFADVFGDTVVAASEAIPSRQTSDAIGDSMSAQSEHIQQVKRSYEAFGKRDLSAILEMARKRVLGTEP
jgi:hypothetical protein